MDPLSSQSWNRYAFVRNNPLRYTDPTGHTEQDNMGVPVRSDLRPPPVEMGRPGEVDAASSETMELTYSDAPRAANAPSSNELDLGPVSVGVRTRAHAQVEVGPARARIDDNGVHIDTELGPGRLSPNGDYRVKVGPGAVGLDDEGPYGELFRVRCHANLSCDGPDELIVSPTPGVELRAGAEEMSASTSMEVELGEHVEVKATYEIYIRSNYGIGEQMMRRHVQPFDTLMDALGGY